jgi:predicted CopG family antitoxin
MSKTITVDDDAYKLLASLKEDNRDSFSKVIRRNIRRPANTCGELLDLMEMDPPMPVNEAVLNQFLKQRGRR